MSETFPSVLTSLVLFCFKSTGVHTGYRDSVDNTVEKNSSVLSHPNVPVAITKGVQAVKLCTNKILQFLTGGAGKRRLTCIVAV